MSHIYATMPAEKILPLIFTTITVTLLKVAAIADSILLIKCLIGKTKKK